MVTPHMDLGRIFDLGVEKRLGAYLEAGADAAISFIRHDINVLLATGLLKVGAQIYRSDALDLCLEYGLEANDDLCNETATARMAWHL